MADRHEMTGLEAGTTLAAMPLDILISTLGVGIAKAQEALDKNSLAAAATLADVTIDIPGPLDGNGQPTIISRSLISLGFSPTFYQFTEATLDLKIEMKMSVEDNLGVSGSVSADMSKGPVAIAGTVSADYSRKYGAESSAMTAVHIAMVAVPPPVEFLEFVRKLDQQPSVPQLPAPAQEAIEA